MTIETRLRQLERAAKRSARKHRCATCKDWPSTLVSYENDWHTAGAQSDAAPPPGAPSSPNDLPPDRRCPNCGFSPMCVVVQYVDDWRTARQSATEQW